MRAQELFEAYTDPDLYDFIRKNYGYRLLGRGADQSVFVDPKTGFVVKIFGTSRNTFGRPRLGDFTPAQRSFLLFWMYCQANTDNEFLPRFFGWKRFQFKNYQYLRIFTERLSEVYDESLRVLLPSLADLVTQKRINPKSTSVDELLSTINEPLKDSLTSLVEKIGAQGLLKLIETIGDLRDIGHNNQMGLDLDAPNWMQRSTGQIVINDPYYKGGQSALTFI